MCYVKDFKGDVSVWCISLDFLVIVFVLMVNVGEGDLFFEFYFVVNDVFGMEYFIVEYDNLLQFYCDFIQMSYDVMCVM